VRDLRTARAQGINASRAATSEFRGGKRRVGPAERVVKRDASVAYTASNRSEPASPFHESPFYEVRAADYWARGWPGRSPAFSKTCR